jgi:nucleoside-diphosphate-sugar epimerase
VTGGAGAIGSNLVKALVKTAKLVIVLDDFSSGYRWNLPSAKNLLVSHGSILDEVMLKRVFFESPEVVFHLAAFFANQNSVDHPELDLQVNGMGTLRMLEYATMCKADRFVYASSGSSIYGSLPKADPLSRLPLKEHDISLKLSTPYQCTKMIGELYCNFFLNHYGLKTSSARFFNSYGPGEVPGEYRNVIPNFTWWAMHGRPLPITGDGGDTRDFTFVGDVIDGLLRMGSSDQAVGEAFNLATGREVAIGQMAETINSLCGNTSGIRYAAARKWDTKRRVWADVSKARERLGYSPDTPFQDGLAAVVDWFQANREHIRRAASFGPGVSSAVREMEQEGEER